MKTFALISYVVLCPALIMIHKAEKTFVFSGLNLDKGTQAALEASVTAGAFTMGTLKAFAANGIPGFGGELASGASAGEGIWGVGGWMG